ncbi:MAG: amidohydrolase [Nocardioides sp.]|nr:amidohydrolase [Nocardioides sp.]
MPQVIDAHQHFWRVTAQDQPWRTAHHDAIARDFEPADLEAELRTAGVDATVLMQSVDEPAENDRLARYAEDVVVAGVVGWLPLRNPADARAELQRLRIPNLVGARCLVADDPLDWLGEPDVVALFRDLAAKGLTWDVVPISPAQIGNVLTLAETVPDLRIVIDHLGRPPVDSRGWEPWANNVERLASAPGISMKVSVGIDVLSAWDAWNGDDLHRYVEHAVRAFGSSRLMLASNWPVVVLRASYVQAWRDLSAAVASCLGDDGYDAVRGENAKRIYQLP